MGSQHDPAIAKDFLLAEHSHFSELLRANEALGEGRMQFLLTLLAAAVAGLVALATAEHPLAAVDLAAVALTASLVLLVAGWFTYERLVKRDRVTEEYIAILDQIRACFDVNSRLADLGAPADFRYNPFPESRKVGRRGHLTRMALAIVVLTAITVVAELGYLIWSGHDQAPVIALSAAGGFLLGRSARAAKAR